MTNRYPWKTNTSQNTADQDDPRYETPGGAQYKADRAEQNAKDYSDQKLNTFKNAPELDIQNGAIVTRHLRDEVVTTPKLAQKAVNLSKVDDPVLDAKNHKYSGKVNAQTVKEAIDIQDDRIQYFIDNSGTSVAELIDARQPVSGTPFPNVKKRLDSSDKWNYGFFQSKLRTTTKINLYGTSITAGVGSTGFSIPADNPIIFDNGTDVYRESNYTCPCWANFLRNYINANYPNIVFRNKGIGGISARYVNTGNNKSFLFDETEDVAFVMFGMNDRGLGDFETNIRSILSYVNARAKCMIVMIENPVLNDNPSINVEMRTVNDTIIRVCEDNGYFYISHYVDMLKYISDTGTPFETLLQTTGSHPVDPGYQFMWNNIQNKLKFTSDQNSFRDRVKTSYYPFNTHNYSTPITEYPFGMSYEQISSAISTDFPEGKPGVLTTYRAKDDNDYSYQEYKVFRSNSKYIRFSEFGVFKKFVAIGNIELALNFASGEKPITDYPWGISYSPMQSSSTGIYGLPDNAGGTVVTYRTQETSPYNYQMFYQYGTNLIFSRYALTNTTWSAWKCMNPITGITRTFGFNAPINSMTLSGLTATIPTADTTKNSYVVSPKSVLDTSLFFSYSVLGTTLYVRLFNASGTAITPGNLEFDVTITRK
ncbi:GDSL-type esterase/lipase family protein [Paenibacillus sp. FSL H7-0690]|uniref:GDSL-type esterase/lipase family protein n=1 Tax=Paenibacillus sp. FSL H7-0690 TaxID=2921437 RepID=UPI0030EC1E61